MSAVLQDEGQFLRSIDFTENLWYAYPDTSPVISAYFSLTQSLYANKDAEMQQVQVWEGEEGEWKNGRMEGKERSGHKGHAICLTKWDILKRTVAMLSQFLTLYPSHPLADDAAFSLANALLDLEDFSRVVRLCQLNQERYPDSDFLTSF